jgi:hypothetical protein
VWCGSAGGDEYRRNSCRASCGALANEASGCPGRASPCGRAGAEAPGPSHVGPRRPCPRRARSIGIWRSATVNNGRSHTDLTCAIGVVSGVDGLPGRAFQARDRGATSGPHSTGGSRTTPDSSGRPTPQLSLTLRTSLQVVRPPGFSLARSNPVQGGPASGRLRRPSPGSPADGAASLLVLCRPEVHPARSDTCDVHPFSAQRRVVVHGRSSNAGCAALDSLSACGRPFHRGKRSRIGRRCDCTPAARALDRSSHQCHYRRRHASVLRLKLVVEVL